MIGRVDGLRVSPRASHWKARDLDVSALLEPALEPEDCLGVYCRHEQDHGLDAALDRELIRLAEPAIARGERVRHDMPIRNSNRVVGGMLSNHIVRTVGRDMLPDGTVHFRFTGSAGQSFGAWLARGVTLEVEGDANDYVGKGLSGGRLIIYPPRTSTFPAEENILIGNVVLYGATSGECFFRGIAAERVLRAQQRCPRGGRGCRRSRVRVHDPAEAWWCSARPGPTSRPACRAASPTSWDPLGRLPGRCNLDMVALEPLEDETERGDVRRMVERHLEYTGSVPARTVLADWERSVHDFVKVMPTDYKRVLRARAATTEPARTALAAPA